MAVKENLEFDSFDMLVEKLQEQENKTNNSSKRRASKAVPSFSVQYYHRKKNPQVVSIEEYKKRVNVNSRKAKTQPKRKTQGNIKTTKEKEEEQKKKMMEQISRNLERKAREEEEAIRREKRMARTEKTTNEKLEEERKRKIAEQISKNLEQRTKEEEAKARKEIAERERMTSGQKTKNEEKKKKHPMAFDRPKRFTEPKKRNLLSRIILQQRLSHYKFEYLEDEYDDGNINEEEIEFSKNATKRKDRRLYKEVQKYEDALEDVTIRKGWNAFKIGLAAAMLAGSLAIVNYSENMIKTDANATSQVVSIYDMDEKEKKDIYSSADTFRQKVIEDDGYHFDNLTEEEFADGYYRIKEYEKNIYEKTLRSAAIKLNEDEKLLNKIVEEAFDDEYVNLTDSQKRDYKQLAYELLPVVLPEYFEEDNPSLRNPIVMDELEAKNNAKTKGYRVKLTVNNSEKETVRNLGNIMHILNGMEGIDYKNTNKDENGQAKFFQNIMIESIGEDAYNQLTSSEKRDYNQIIYEWLSDDAKQYIQDPIETEKTNDIEIGD